MDQKKKITLSELERNIIEYLNKKILENNLESVDVELIKVIFGL